MGSERALWPTDTVDGPGRWPGRWSRSPTAGGHLLKKFKQCSKLTSRLGRHGQGVPVLTVEMPGAFKGAHGSLTLLPGEDSADLFTRQREPLEHEPLVRLEPVGLSANIGLGQVAWDGARRRLRRRRWTGRTGQRMW